MFGDPYAVMREHRGLGQFARVAVVFRAYRRTITFKPIVRFVMRIVAGVASAGRLKGRTRAVGAS